MTSVAYDLTRLSTEEKAGLEKFLNTTIDTCMHKTLIMYGRDNGSLYPFTLKHLLFDRIGNINELLEKCLELGEIK